MNALVEYQINVFGDFYSLKADNHTVLGIMNLLKDFDFLPGHFLEQNQGKMSLIPRILLSSLDGKQTFQFFTDKITFNAVSSKGPESLDPGFSQKEIEDINSTVYNLIDKVMQNYDISAYMFLVAVRHIYYRVETDEISRMNQTLFSPIKYYEGTDIAGNQICLIKNEPISVFKKEEQVNVITNITRIFQQINLSNEINGYRIEIKISTNSNNTSPRFEIGDLASFVAYTKEKENLLLQQIIIDFK